VKKKTGKVRIRGKWWKIEIKRLPPTRKEGRWLPVHGLCDYKQKTIFLNPQFNMRCALLHEITHACQPDLDELTVEEIEDAHVNGLAVLETLWQ
jgi:hypothetical protein